MSHLKLSSLSKALIASKDNPLQSVQLLISTAELLQQSGFHVGSLHAYATAKRHAANVNLSCLMNSTAAMLVQQVRLGQKISRAQVEELHQLCKRIGGEEGSWALCVVASKCYLAFDFQQAFSLFTCSLSLDSQSEGSKIALVYAGDCLCAASGNQVRAEWSQMERWTKAEEYYKSALILDSNFFDAKSSLAELLRKRGALEQSLLQFESMYDDESSDESSVINLDLIFNHSQCLETMCRCGDALMLLTPHAESAVASLPLSGDVERVSHHALILLYIKLRYVVAGGGDALVNDIVATPWKKLLSLVQQWSWDVEVTIRSKLPTHWAFCFFVRNLWTLHQVQEGIQGKGKGASCRTSTLAASPHCALPPNTTGYFQDQAWIPIVGDSHCLSLSWTKIGATTVVPFVATGLKAFHLRRGCEFSTVSNLRCILSRLQEMYKMNPHSQPGANKCLFCCGEIDCREGIPSAVAAGKYTNVENAVESTVRMYLNSMEKKYKETGFLFLLLTVPPPVNRTQVQRARTVRMFNQELRHQIVRFQGLKLLDIESECCNSDPDSDSGYDGFLKEELNADGTHTNQKIVNFVIKRMKELDDM